MGYPNGVSLAVVSGGTAFTAFGDDVPVQITVTPRFPKQGGGFLTRIVHAATGWVMTSDPDTFTADAGTEVSFSVPHVDQAGFRDPAQNAYTGWYYEVKVVVGAARGRTKTAYTQTVSPVVGQALVDLDLVPEGQTGAPQSVTVPEVLSVNGQTGAVVVEAGADDGEIANLIHDTSTATGAALSANYVASSGVARIVPVHEGDALPSLTSGDLVVTYKGLLGGMYGDNFAATAAGAAPAGWSQPWGQHDWTVVDDATATDGKSLKAPPTSGRAFLSLDAVNSDIYRADAEVLFRLKLMSTGGVSAVVRGAGAVTTETGFRLGIQNGDARRAGIYKDGLYMNIQDTVGTSVVGVWSLVRVQIRANVLRVKAWPDTQPEPTTWGVDTAFTDNNWPLNDAGMIGLGVFNSTAEAYIDWVSVATGERTAVAR